MFQAFEHEKFQKSLIDRQSLAYKNQKIEEYLKKIEKLNGKISNLEGKTIKTASNLLQTKALQQELIATEELLKGLLGDGQDCGNEVLNEPVSKSRGNILDREELIRKGLLNPLERQETPSADLASVQKLDVFLQDKSGDKDYLDDGDIEYYQSRYLKYALDRYKERTGDTQTPQLQVLNDEEFQSINSKNDYTIDRLTIPSEIYEHLFEYQKTCLRWFYELYNQRVGGVLGDEMGLGKTVQVITFLAGMRFSKLIYGPVLIVCPATVLRQWVQEFHKWYPAFRVVILHSSGSALGGNGYAYDSEEGLDDEDEYFIKDSDEEVLTISEDDKESGSTRRKISKPKVFRKRKRVEPETSSKPRIVKDLINSISNSKNPEIIVTTYSSMRIYKEYLLPVHWGYAILDEGHKIRNPDADITITCKQLQTNNRIILSGTPIQNNLPELWSLYDSEECSKVVSKQIQTFKGIDTLRKICNHPDLLVSKEKLGKDYGNIDRSGKLLVVAKLLSIWQDQGHKVLLFTQTRQMLDILEKFAREKYSYSRMDGNTPIQNRARMVDDFNTSSTFLFLLTTKVGGLGINLTGANRIIIFDPDWNPSTDMQARERAWRLGQTKPVTIYRLLISGSIEEKIYHRQIYKQFLTNKVLVDPKQERFFKSNDLSDLFTLDVRDNETETGDMFAGSKVLIEEDVHIVGAEDYGGYDKDQGDDDSRILQALVGDGIHSALQHDMIVGASNPEKKIIDRESRLVAQKAVDALRKSRSTVKTAPAFKPTWTGKTGDAGKPRTYESSSSLLHGLRQKSGMVPKTIEADLEHLAGELRDFLSSRGLVTSKSVMEKFEVKGNAQILKLRTMLREIADFSDSTDGKGWILKPEFR